MKVKIHNHPFELITQMYLAGSLGIEFAVITYQSMKLLDMVTWNTWRRLCPFCFGNVAAPTACLSECLTHWDPNFDHFQDQLLNHRCRSSAVSLNTSPWLFLSIQHK